MISGWDKGKILAMTISLHAGYYLATYSRISTWKAMKDDEDGKLACSLRKKPKLVLQSWLTPASLDKSNDGLVLDFDTD